MCSLRVPPQRFVSCRRLAGVGFGSDVEHLELAPAALGDPPHVMVEHLDTAVLGFPKKCTD
jgi:hypothetical protein